MNDAGRKGFNGRVQRRYVDFREGPDIFVLCPPWFMFQIEKIYIRRQEPGEEIRKKPHLLPCIVPFPGNV